MSLGFRKLIRGGQTQLHELNMAREYLRIVYLFSLPIFGIIFGAICYFTTDEYMWNYLLNYYKAKWFAMTWHGKEIVEFMGVIKGVPIPLKATADSISTNLHIIASKNEAWAVLYQNFIYACVGFVICLVIMFILSRRRGEKLHETEYIRGATLVSAKQLKKEIIKFNKKTNCKSKIELAGMPMPGTAQFLSHLIVGGPGTGKTIILFDLVEQLKAQGDKVLIYDMKGTFASIFYDNKKDTLLNPFDMRGSGWNIFHEVKSKADLENIAHALIPHTKDSSDPFWTDGARILFREICGKLLEKSQKTGEIPTNKQLSYILQKESADNMAKYLKGTTAASIFDKEPEKHAKSIIAVLNVFTNFLSYIDDKKENFSIKKWVGDEKEKGNLFITSGVYHNSIRSLLTTWIDLAINSVLQIDVTKPNKPNIWFILDELPSLYKLPNLSYGMEVLREYGCSFIIAMQSISKMQEIYGDKGMEVLSGVTNTKIILRNTSEKSANWCSDALGSQEVRQFEESYSMGAHQYRDGVNVRKQQVTRKLVLPWEIMALEKTNSYSKGYINFAGFPSAQIKVDFKGYPQKYPGYIEKIQKYYKAESKNEEQHKIKQEHEAKPLINQNKKGKKTMSKNKSATSTTEAKNPVDNNKEEKHHHNLGPKHTEPAETHDDEENELIDNLGPRNSGEDFRDKKIQLEKDIITTKKLESGKKLPVSKEELMVNDDDIQDKLDEVRKNQMLDN